MRLSRVIFSVRFRFILSRVKLAPKQKLRSDVREARRSKHQASLCESYRRMTGNYVENRDSHVLMWLKTLENFRPKKKRFVPMRPQSTSTFYDTVHII